MVNPRLRKIKLTPKTLLVVLASGAALTILAAMLVDGLATSPREAAHEFAAAQARWDGRPFSHYRLVSQFSSNNPSVGHGCRRDLEIQGEQIIQVFQNTCPGWSEGMTVTDIFRLFRRYVPQTAKLLPTPLPGSPTPTPYPQNSTLGKWVRASDGCSYYFVIADYDAQLGYPHQIETQLRYISASGTFSCLAIDPPRYVVTILLLTPIK